MKKERQSNIELFRIVLMLMIIMHHLIVHGCKLKTLLNNDYVSTSETRDMMYLFINTICVVGVNCFIIISGFYGIKIKLKTLISFITQSSVLSVILYIVSFFLLDSGDFSYKRLIYRFFPLLFPVWWFLCAYIGLYLLSPIINKGIEATKKEYLIFICVGLLVLIGTSSFNQENIYIENGYNIFTLLLVYVFARCCAVVIPNINNAAKLYVFSTIINFIVVVILFKYAKQETTWQFFCYGNPLIIINAILLFYSFKNLKIKRHTLILSIAPLTFGIYLIHDYGEVRHLLVKIVFYLNNYFTNNILFVLILICLALIIFISCGVVEKIRAIIFTPVNELLYQKSLTVYSSIKKKPKSI